MKRIINIVLAVSLLLLCVILTTSCGSRLEDPDGFYLDEQTLVLNWNKIKGARSYAIQISGEEREKVTRTNSISLEYLEAGNYTIQIKAVGDGVEVKDSGWATYDFVRAVESGLKYKLVNGNTEYQVVGGGVATGDVIVDDFYRGKPVTSIADKAFYNNSRITSITIGANVTSIGTKAFSKCSSLVSVVIPENVTSIGDNTFQSSKALVSVSLPESITAINPFMFSWCSALSEVKLGSKITSIGENAFSSCKALTSIDLPDTVTVIGEYAFSDCTALASVDIGDNVEKLATYAFAKCIVLENILLPETLVSIDEYAFTGCEKLTKIIIPNSVETLGIEAFSACTSLSDITLGAGLTKIGAAAFVGTAFYEAAPNLVTSGGWVIETKDKAIKKIELPAEIYGIADYAFINCKNLSQLKFTGIKYVGDYSFYGCKDVWECIFDNSLIKIGSAAFAYCSNLSTISLGNSLDMIDSYAFYECSMLSRMTLPNSLTCIGGSAFVKTNIEKLTPQNSLVYVDNWIVGANIGQYSAILTDIVIKEGTRGVANYALYQKLIAGNIIMPDSLEYIGRSAFYEIYSPEIILSKNLKKIDDYAFYGCSSTSFGDNGTLTVPSGVDYVGRSAFYGCSKIFSLVVPPSVKTVGPYAFYECVNLGKTIEATEVLPEFPAIISLAEGIEYIGDRAFQGCESITEITIPSTVTYMGSHLFYKCIALKNVTVNANIDTIREYTFYNCEALESVNFANSIKKINKYAFRGCILLSEIELPEIEYIGDFAFYKCESLTEFYMPETLEHLGNYAFRGCIGIDTVIVPNTVVSIGKHAFYGLSNTTIYCELATAPGTWNERFNSSYRPIFWGCTLSADDSYVVSFTTNATNPDNISATATITAPERAGYTFAGWSTVSGSTEVTYTCDTITSAPAGTVLYTVWVPATN